MENNENITNTNKKTTAEKFFGTKEERKVVLKYLAIILPSMATGSLLTLGAVMLKNKSESSTPTEAPIDIPTTGDI